MADIAELDFLQQGPGAAPGYSARQLRKFSQEMLGVGVYDRGSHRVTFASGLTFNISAGRAFFRGKTNADQGLYRSYHATTDPALSVTLSAAHATLPRIDRIILQVQDNAEDSQGNNKAVPVVVTGGATAGATLDNLVGAVDPGTLASPTYILLADVLISANNTPPLSSASVRDRRVFATRSVVPPLLTDIDCVQLEPAPGIPTTRMKINGTDHQSKQAAALMYLHRRIPATHIRWNYQQDDTAPGDVNYIFAIADASGRIIANTAATLMAGAINTQHSEVVPFNPALPAGYMFEAGAYYVYFAIGVLGAAKAIHCFCMSTDTGTHGYIPATPNLFLRATSGGAVLPATGTILGLQDVTTRATGSADLPIPMTALSVG